MYLVYDGLFDRIRKVYFKKVIRTCGLSKQSKVLDFGCGPGDFLFVANAMGIDASGVDAFPRSVELARARGLNVALYDEATIDWPHEYFDTIILQSVIEHIDDPISVIRRLTVFLKYGGFLVVSAPTPGAHFWDDPTHIRPYTPQALRTFGELVELKVEGVSYVFSYLLGFSISNAIVYKLMNLLPLSLGSNIVAFYRK
jgi:2-polyprenyl-3-methyl-5-hydroxy-6-metoxy-1,4-benzoquinol methylase